MVAGGEPRPPYAPCILTPKTCCLVLPRFVNCRGAWHKLPKLVVGALLAVYRPTSLLLGTPALCWLCSRSRDQGPPARIPASYSPDLVLGTLGG